ncbi:patronus 1-like protein [Tanacetum coccineum]
MAMHASRMTQDQNFSVHSDGAKMNESTVKKNKGGLGVRKALNDISNSVKPSALQPLRKQNLKNVLPIGEDVGVGKKPLAKAQASGRKALGDLTNMVKPFGQQQGLKNKSQVKQSLTIAEDVPYSIAEEGFRHNHDECVKQQKNVSFDDFNEFLHAIGHENDPLFQSVSTACKPLPRKPKEDNAFMIFEMEEIAEDHAFGSPIFKSPPKSPKMSSVSFLNYDTGFILAGQAIDCCGEMDKSFVSQCWKDMFKILKFVMAVFKPGSKVLYFGAASGTTVSHVCLMAQRLNTGFGTPLGQSWLLLFLAELTISGW